MRNASDRSIARICLLALTLAAVAPGTIVARGRGDGGRTSITVVSDDNYPPYIFVARDGSLQGIVVDQWKAWEKATGVEVHLRALSWSLAQESMRRGEADIIDTLFKTEERSRIYSFSAPYARIEVPVFIHRTISGITSLDDLRGFRVAAKAGDAALAELSSGGVTDIATFPSYEAIIEAASASDVKIFCIDAPPAYYYLNKKGLGDDFRIAFIMNSGDFHRAARKGDEELLRLVEDGFAAIPPAELESIDRKWLGSALPRNVDTRFMKAAAAIVAALIGALAFSSWELRRRVARATADLKEKVALLESSEAKNLLREHELRVSLVEKEILLKEVHHRVKNNMQIISSLIQIQSYAFRDEADRELLRETQARIRAMAAVHELLYQSADITSIDSGEYLEKLAKGLSAGYDASGVRYAADAVKLDIDSAVPLGLVANELLLNAIKYAYDPPGSGTIDVAIRVDGEDIILSVKDAGKGLPAGLDPYVTESMGLTLVRNLALQLRGSVAFRGPPGFEATVRFPKDR